MKFRMLALLGLLAFAWTEPAFAQLPPPTPQGPAALEGQTKITAATTTSRVALPSVEPNAKAVTIYNSGLTDVYFVLGNSTVTATSANTLIKAGTYLTVWRDTNTHLAAISASSTDDLIIYQGNGVLQFGQVGGGGGGGGSGNVTGPGSSTDGGVALFDGTTGQLLKDGPLPSMTIGGAATALGGTVSATTILDSLGSTRGSVLYRGAVGWTVLTPGTSGFFLKSNGAGADPAYAAAPGGGTVTSLTGGNGILVGASSPCTTACTIDLTVTRNAQTGTTYATLATDGGKLVSLSNASPVAVSLSQANQTGFTAGFGTDFNNIGAGLVTVTATTSTFDNGLTTILVAKGQDAYVWSDGTNYHSIMSQPVAANSTVMGNVSGASNYPVALTATQLTTLVNAFTSGLSGAAPASGGGTTNFLRADGTWAAPPGGGGTSNSNWVAGNWYNAANSLTANGVNISATVTEWVPVFFDRPVTIGSIGGRVTTNAAGNMQFAVYASSSSTGLPTGSALCATASLSTASTGSLGSACIGTPALASAGRYWIGYQVDNATAAIMSASGTPFINSLIGTSSQINLSGSGTSAATEYKTTGGTFGTWPTNPTITQASITNAVVPQAQFSLSSVP